MNLTQTEKNILRIRRNLTPSQTSSSNLSLPVSEQSRSVPSLYDAFNPSRNESQQHLAFTSEELDLSTSSLGHDARRGSPASVGKIKKIKKHGQMVASSDILLPDNNQSLVTQSSILPAAGRVLTISKGDNGVVRTAIMQDNTVPLRAKPTVTTILRQQLVLDKAEKKEKDKVESLCTSNSHLVSTDQSSKAQDLQQMEAEKAAEAKRLLQTRLAYERAKAASRKMIDEKQKIAENTRLQEKEWQSRLIKQRQAEIESRKSVTEALYKATEDSKRAVEDMFLMKQLLAKKLKEESEQLHAAARLRQQEEDLIRQSRIQQIQASKLVLKRAKDSTMGNPHQFYRSIAIPETQIKLRLQKEEVERRQQEKRKKIQAEKQLKSVKLIKAMKKIHSHEISAQAQRSKSKLKVVPNSAPHASLHLNITQLFPPTKAEPNSPAPSSIQKYPSVNALSSHPPQKCANSVVKTPNNEIEDMLEELQKLKLENNKMKKQLFGSKSNTSGIARTVQDSQTGTRSNHTFPSYYDKLPPVGVLARN